MRTNRTGRAASAAIAAAAWLACAGCEGGNNPSWRISRTRVLGARVEAGGDPARARPAPGERFRVTWLVVDPDEPRGRAWAFEVCVALPDSGGIPACRDDVAVTVSGNETTPTFELELPDAATFGDAERLLVLGVICTGEGVSAEADPPLGRCTGDVDDASAVSTYVWVDPGDDPNANPSLAEATVTLDGSVWSPTVPGAEPCGDGALEVAADADALDLTIALPPDVREPVEDGLEEALVSHLVTAGDIERQFSVVPAEQRDTTPLTVEWTPPDAEDVPLAGLPVDLVLVLRDFRGGMDWTTRTLCVAH